MSAERRVAREKEPDRCEVCGAVNPMRCSLGHCVEHGDDCRCADPECSTCVIDHQQPDPYSGWCSSWYFDD